MLIIHPSIHPSIVATRPFCLGCMPIPLMQLLEMAIRGPTLRSRCSVSPSRFVSACVPTCTVVHMLAHLFDLAPLWVNTFLMVHVWSGRTFITLTIELETTANPKHISGADIMSGWARPSGWLPAPKKCPKMSIRGQPRPLDSPSMHMLALPSTWSFNVRKCVGLCVGQE